LGSYQFDLDLTEGQIAEANVRDLLMGRLGPIEVKRDTKVSESGKIAVEFECRGWPSGIKTTTAVWWVFELAGGNYQDKILIWIETERLRTMCDWHIDKGDWVYGGDGKQAKMVLLRLSRLLLWDPQVTKTKLATLAKVT